MNLVDVVIQVTSEERDQLETRALAQGFDSVDAYLKALIALDMVDPTPAEIRAGIKQGLREALRGEYVSLDTLWDDDDD